MNNQPTPREDIYYPYCCHAYWYEPKKFHVIYSEALNDPIIIKTFNDWSEGRAYAKKLNIAYLHESGWYDRENRININLQRKRNDKKVYSVLVGFYLGLLFFCNVINFIRFNN